MNVTCILKYDISRVHVQYNEFCDCHESTICCHETKLCVYIQYILY